MLARSNLFEKKSGGGVSSIKNTSTRGEKGKLGSKKSHCCHHHLIWIVEKGRLGKEGTTELPYFSA